MEYVQERVTTLHDFEGTVPDAPAEEATVVVPLTERDQESAAAERIFRALSSLSLESVLVALRAEPRNVASIADWLSNFDAPIDVLWCNAPRVERLLAEAGLDGTTGKGLDVWLALGVAAERSRYVVLNDADAENYTAATVRKLLVPLANGHEFSKGYYARIENRRLYGRLFRLFYVPLVRALANRQDEPILLYLSSLRYALAGECALTANLARSLRVQRGWGLEASVLGEAFDHAGFEGTAQVDLGRHEHSHRPVTGRRGLEDMAGEVGEALFQVVENAGVRPDYETLPDRYRRVADGLIEQYELDATFNDLEYDAAAERAQVETYANHVEPPETATRLPAWTDTPLDPASVAERAGRALAPEPER